MLMQSKEVMDADATKRMLAAIKAAGQRGGGKNGGWKQSHQLDAIMALVAEECGCALADYDGTALRAAVNKLCNASATRQQLEKAGVIVVQAQGTRSKPALFAGFDMDSADEKDEQTPDNQPE